MPFFASECGGLRRLWEECCSPARSLRRLQVSLLWLSFRNPVSDISKEEYFTFHESYITHLLHLKGKPSLPVPFSTAILEHTLSTVHCFDIFRIFPQRSRFSSGAEEEPQSLWYPKHRAFLSQVLGNMQGSSAGSTTGIYKHEENLNRKLQTVARVCFGFFNSPCYHWSIDDVVYVITTSLYITSATLAYLQTQVFQLQPYNGTRVSSFV